jgi:hypothetical protein
MSGKFFGNNMINLRLVYKNLYKKFVTVSSIFELEVIKNACSLSLD